MSVYMCFKDSFSEPTMCTATVWHQWVGAVHLFTMAEHKTVLLVENFQSIAIKTLVLIKTQVARETNNSKAAASPH